jgi:hypothetical protein
VFGDASAVRKYLVAFGVLLGWDVAQLLQQRHVDIRLDVTRYARVPVPVPGAAHVGGLVDEPDAAHAEFPQPGSGEQTTETGADDRDIDLVRQRIAREVRIAPRVVGKTSKRTSDLEILRNTVGPQSPVPLKGVFLPQSVHVECHVGASSECRFLASLTTPEGLARLGS